MLTENKIQINWKYMAFISFSILIIMTLARLLLSDVPYLISSVLVGLCGVGLYFNLKKK
jgi:hypothetical protein